jgi:CO/xanthine dehydrogenase FAD-binding subunit
LWFADLFFRQGLYRLGKAECLMPFNIQSLEHYYSPRTVEEACSLLSSNQDFIPIAGGSAIYIFSAKGLLQDIRGLVSLSSLPLNGIHGSDAYVELGATVTHQELLESRLHMPTILREALLTIPKEVRSVGTVGGQLCTCFPNFDLNVALLALDAEIMVTGSDQVRREGIEKFFKGVLEPDLTPGEIVTGIMFPKKRNLLSGYSKSALTAHGFSLISVGVSLEVSGGFFEDARVAVGGTLNTCPVRLKSVEDALRGHPVTSDTISEAAGLAHSEGALNVGSDHKSSSEYKRRLASVLIKRTILRVVGL